MLVHINLGSNVEPRVDHLREALRAIRKLPRTKVIGASRLYHTEAVGVDEPDPSPFLNMCASLRTALTVRELFAALQELEARLGRDPATKGTKRSRTIDIDLCLAKDLVIQEPDLVVPHPKLLERSFFLWPLVEICPNAVYPPTKTPLRAFLQAPCRPPILRTLPSFTQIEAGASNAP